MAPGGALAAGPPDNDDIAYPAPVSLPIFGVAPDMTNATLQVGEPLCDETDGQMNESVWYRMDLDTAAVVRVEVNGEPFHHVTAGIYGPFDELPTSAEDLPQLGCIYDAGPDYAGTEQYAAGTYLVQLSAVPDAESPSLKIEELFTIVNPWSVPSSVSVPAGIPTSIEWGWYACTVGLAKTAPAAIAQTYVLRLDGNDVNNLSPEDSALLWSPVEVAGRSEACQSRSPSGGIVGWVWYLDPPLPAGDYQLDVVIVATRNLTDGFADENGRPIRYPAGTVFLNRNISISVVASD